MGRSGNRLRRNIRFPRAEAVTMFTAPLGGGSDDVYCAFDGSDFY